jgi:segregation and condensation protein A
LANRVPISVRLDSFEGPLDLLLYLIQSHEMDISKISITRITDQYLAYVKLMQELNFDVASEFLVMAATLLFWKSRSLMPENQVQAQDGQATDEPALTQEDLIRQLLEHQRFRQAGSDLAQLPRLAEDVFVRPNRRPPVEKVWKEMQITGLATAYQDMLGRQRKRTQILKKETVSLAGKITEFVDKLTVGKPTPMSRFIAATRARPEVVVTFLASLELSRMKKLKLHQEKTYEEIYLELIEHILAQDLHMAGAGFEYQAHQALSGGLEKDIAQAKAEAQTQAVV